MPIIHRIYNYCFQLSSHWGDNRTSPYVQDAGDADGSIKLASSLNPELCLTTAPLPHAEMNITLQVRPTAALS